MKKLKIKILMSSAIVTMLLGTVTPSFALVTEATDNARIEQVQLTEDSFVELSKIEEVQYHEEMKKSQEALEIIEEKYEEAAEEVNINNAEEIENADEYTLTLEDEARINQATGEYLKMVGYNPRLRGFGRNWWNSRGFVTAVIDVALVVIGIGAGIRATKAVMSIINANRTNITRVVKNQIASRIGINVSGVISGALNIATAASGLSIGGAISWGLDRADGRYDGYILA